MLQLVERARVVAPHFDVSCLHCVSFLLQCVLQLVERARVAILHIFVFLFALCVFLVAVCVAVGREGPCSSSSHLCWAHQRNRSNLVIRVI